MADITFFGYWGDEKRLVDLGTAYGSPDGSYQIIIDDHYFGVIRKENGKWIGRLNRSGERLFTTDDIQILGDIIDESEKV